MLDKIICQNCGTYPQYIKYLSKQFSEEERKRMLKGIGWVLTDNEILCPVCKDYPIAGRILRKLEKR